MGRRNCQGEQVEEKTWQEGMVEERRRVGAVKLHFPKNICRVLVFDILLLERIITIPPPLPSSAFPISICFSLPLWLYLSVFLYTEWDRLTENHANKFWMQFWHSPYTIYKKGRKVYFILFFRSKKQIDARYSIVPFFVYRTEGL